jgi:hypothetical protein
MAHFAQLDENNRVTQVIVISNEDGSSEAHGIAFIKNVLNLDGTWVQTSYNSNIRGKFAGVGDLYDLEKDEFVIDPVWQKEQKAIMDKQIAEEKAIEDSKAAAQAKLKALGLTADDLKALLS